MKRGFDRKVFSTRRFWGDLGFLLANLPGFAAAARDPQVSPQLVRKTMLVVTAVNGCTYCHWFHAKQAANSGMSEAEIRDTFNMQFEASAEPQELPALLYAQHYAETDRHPDPEMTARLVAHYGEATARHILLFIRMIFFGNLFGNTFDAFLSRLQGSKAEGSSPWFEAAFFLLTFWFMLPLKWVMERQQRRRQAAAQ